MISDRIRLRPYRKGDLEAVYGLDQLCFAEEFRFDRDSMRLFLEARNACTVIAESQLTGVVGFVIAHLKRQGEGVHGYVLTIDVAGEQRRGGLGARLMREVEGQLAAVGATWVGLHVFVGNGEAIGFYERIGYERQRRVGGFYGKEVDAWLYRKGLNGPAES